MAESTEQGKKPQEPKKQPKDWVPKELADWMIAGMNAYAADPDKYDRERAEWESNVKVKQFSEEKDDEDDDADVIDEPYWNKGEDESAATEPEGAPEPEVPDEMPKPPNAENSPFAGRKSGKAFMEADADVKLLAVAEEVAAAKATESESMPDVLPPDDAPLT